MADAYYVISATLPAGNRVRGFFDGGPDSPASLLERPPAFRDSGFDLGTRDVAKLVDGNCLEVRRGDRKLLQLYQDGTLVFRADAGPNFLGWGTRSGTFADYPLLNPVPVVESNTAFVHLYAALIPKLAKVPEFVLFKLRLNSAPVGKHRLAITAYYSTGIQYVVDPKIYQIHSLNAEEQISIPTAEVRSKPNAAAYKIVGKFYDLFDAGVEVIPFLKMVDGRREIDLDAIKEL